MSWIIAAILSAVFAALVAVFGKIGVKSVDTTVATTVRAIVMAGVLIIATLSLGKGHLFSSFSSRTLTFVVLSGLAGAVSWLFYFFALRYGPATAVAALDRLSIVFVVVLAALFLNESLSWKAASGAVLMSVGAILLVLK